MNKNLLSALVLGLVVIITSFTLRIEPATLNVDTNSSSIKWTGYHIAKSYSHWGYIKVKSGNLEVENGDLTGGEITIDMTSISNADLEEEKDNQKLVGHLKSEDFFYVEKYPEASLEIKNVAKDGMTYNVTGDVTIRGITEEIEFPVEKLADGKYSAKLTIDRTKHEVLYGWSLENVVIGNDFDLEIELVAK